MEISPSTSDSTEDFPPLPAPLTYAEGSERIINFYNRSADQQERLLKDPYARVGILWTKWGHSGLSPATFAVVGKRSPEQVLKELKEIGGVKVEFCYTTWLPVINFLYPFRPPDRPRKWGEFTNHFDDAAANWRAAKLSDYEARRTHYAAFQDKECSCATCTKSVWDIFSVSTKRVKIDPPVPPEVPPTELTLDHFISIIGGEGWREKCEASLGKNPLGRVQTHIPSLEALSEAFWEGWIR